MCTPTHKENLLNYKKNNKVPKGLLLKFNLALRTNNNVLKGQCNNILFIASSQIHNKIIKALDKQRKKNRRFNRNLLTQQRKNKNKRRKENYCIKINEIKANDHNAINYHNVN